MSSTPGKRKNDDEETPQRRAKRNRYISIACNECKRRKIKCNGQNPCQRCGNLNLECVYAPNCCNGFKESEEYREISSNITDLQRQVQNLYANLNSLKVFVESKPDPIEMTSSPDTAVNTNNVAHNGPKYPRFHGPTSAAFGLGVAKNSLTRNFGIIGSEGNGEESRNANEASSIGSPPPVHSNPSRKLESCDVLWLINKVDALRLVNIWRDQLHILYPIVDLEKVVDLVQHLYSDSSENLSISDDDLSTIRLILANSIELESNGSSQFGLELFKSVTTVIESILMRPPSFKCLEILILSSLFHFHRDDEIMSWRLNGVAARMMFELGFHQQETYNLSLKNHSERYKANVFFWTIYVLDRRWSFGTGLPFAIQEVDIDPDLIKPNPAYLCSMSQLTSMTSKIWPKLAPGTANKNPDISELEFLDMQVIKWQQNLPEALNYSKIDQDPPSHVNTHLRVLLYLRASQARVLFGRQILLSTNAIMDNLTYASNVVDVAKDTIQVLNHLNQTTETYRKQQSLYNYFLISALAALFLAVAHAPVQFSNRCKDEFHMALDLVRSLSTTSFIGRRLWNTIRVLKEIGPKIGLIRNTSSTNDADSDAAVAMAGLAGHPIENLTAVYPPLPNETGWDNNWGVMADDLGGLFEAAGNMPGPVSSYEKPMTSMFATTDSLSRAFKDLF